MDKLFRDLVRAYDRAADERDKNEIAAWKKDLRWKFLNLLEEEGKSRLIDIGAGSGVHGKFFQDQGIDVTCLDLSPANIEKCHQKGLKTYLFNVLELGQIGQSFDCGFALNSLLHIPTRLLPAALANISRVIGPNGLFFWGQYGGEYREGVYQDDGYQPKRFFSLLTDTQMQDLALRSFVVEEFWTILIEDLTPLYFQAMLARVPSGL